MSTYVVAETPSTGRRTRQASRTRQACGAVFITASPRSTAPTADPPPTVAAPTMVRVQAATQRDGPPRDRRATTMAISPHSTAPDADDAAAIGRPATRA